MCYDLNEYDPFEPLMFDVGQETYIYDEPMEEYNWEEWLDNGGEPCMV